MDGGGRVLDADDHVALYYKAPTSSACRWAACAAGRRVRPAVQVA